MLVKRIREGVPRALVVTVEVESLPVTVDGFGNSLFRVGDRWTVAPDRRKKDGGGRRSSP